jgi:predicted phosphoadenosine phosphosulfate sulfurtransferase
MECANHRTIALISHTSKVLLKIIQSRLERYMERELPDVQAGFRKKRGTRDHISNLRLLMERAREYNQEIYLCFIDYNKAFDCVDHARMWNTLQQMGIPEHLIVLIPNLYES